MIQDNHGRQFQILRLSLTNRCNFACQYCVDQGTRHIHHTNDSLKVSEHLALVENIHSMIGLHAIRLTGGEPSLFQSIIPLVEGLKRIGIPRIHLTSNGSLLSGMLKDLWKAGLSSVNISLDAINPGIFKLMAGRNGVKDVLSSIEAALDCGLSVKVNTTVMKGVNDSEILPLINEITSKGISIRFLELMKMGHLHNDFHRFFLSEQDILSVIKQQYQFKPLPRKKSATANYWITDDNRVFGIIANSSSPFCRDCNRLRLDHRGYLYGCISNDIGYDIRHISQQKDLLEHAITKALAQKQDYRFSGSQITMMAIGG